MPSLFGRPVERSELMRRVGSWDQLAGITAAQFADGPARGQRLLEFRTGSGLRFTVLPDRGMDLGAAEWRGIPLAWHAPVGWVGPWYHEPQGNGFLRTFGGGLLVTCGLSNVGPACDDAGEHHGLHGRVSHLAASEVAATSWWQGEDYVLEARGVVREARIFGENLVLRRSWRTRLGSDTVELADRITNEGFAPCPLMVLYHVNVGYPLVDEGARLVVRPRSQVEPRDHDAAAGLEEHDRGAPPTPGFREQVFRHRLAPSPDGTAAAAWINPALGVGLRVRYRPAELPYLWQWRMLGEGTYVVGIEPANCHVMGRAYERARGRAAVLEPGASVDVHLELGVLTTPSDLAAAEENPS